MNVAQVLACDPSATDAGVVHNSICPPLGAQFFKATPHEALMLDANAAYAFSDPSPVDIGLAFSVTFTVTLILWMTAKGFGTVLSFVRTQVR